MTWFLILEEGEVLMATSSGLKEVEVVLTVLSSDLVVEVVRLEGQEEQEAVEVQEVSF